MRKGQNASMPAVSIILRNSLYGDSGKVEVSSLFPDSLVASNEDDLFSAEMDQALAEITTKLGGTR